MLNLYVSGTSNLGNTTILSNLNISNNMVINNSLYGISNLNILNTTILNNNTSINSSLNISGPMLLYGNNTLLANLNVLGQIITKLPNYFSNSIAKAAGIPIWGLYRTGGILKVRVNDDPPSITLIGSSNINITQGTTFIEPGISIYSSIYSNIKGYITSINDGSNNIINNPILVSGNSTLIAQTSSLSIGSYVITYNATDPDGLVGVGVRTLTVPAPPAQPPSGLTNLPKGVSQYGNVFSLTDIPIINSGDIQSASMSYSGSIISFGITTGGDYGAIYIYQIINNVWTQLGNIIIGATNDRMTFAKLSYDGLTIIVSGPEFSTTLYYGKVEVYNYNGSSWIKKGQTLYGDTNVCKRFGHDVFISYDCNIITILRIPKPSLDSILQVYKYNGNEWIELGTSINTTLTFFGVISCAASSNSTGLIHAFSGNTSSRVPFMRVNKYNSQSSTWEQLGSTITRSLYNLNGDPIIPFLSESGNIMVVLSYFTNTFYSFFYNNVDWVIMGSNYNTNITIPINEWWHINSTSANCMIFSSSMVGERPNQQLYGFKDSAWQFIGYYDTEYQYMDGGRHSSKHVCISGNGKYVVCCGTENIYPMQLIRLRTYQFI